MKPISLKYSIVIFTLIIFSSLQGRHTIESPDGRLQLFIHSLQESVEKEQNDTVLSYSIKYDGQTVVEPSPFFLEFGDGTVIGQPFEITGTSYNQVNKETELLYGKNQILDESYNESRFLIKTGSDIQWLAELIVRVYDEAVAFRFRIPEQAQKKQFKIVSENLNINLPADPQCFALPLSHFRTSYENNYTVDKLSGLPKNQLYGLPFLMQIKSGLWLAVTEADLTNYSGMYLTRPENTSNTLLSRLAPHVEDSSYAVKGQAPQTFPWRVFMIADHPGRFIESDVILSLARPSVIESPCWIKPGKVAWPWWSGRVVEGRFFEGGMNTNTMKYYIDFAAENQVEYLLIDAEWYGRHDTDLEDITTTIPQINMPHIIDYATQKNVGVWLWLNWQCVRDQMDEAFPLYESWGIKGIKVDYMNRDDQSMVQFYEKVLQTAARYHLMVNFHGAYKPTGLRRTYPNLLTREGVLGLEYSKWSASCNPEHDVILPFTRMLAGPMDYTPGAFQVAGKADFKAQFTAPMAMGTRAHQLAMYVIFESPLQMLVDHPVSYFGKTGLDFLSVVPTDWDETRFVSGEPGEFVVIARRKGQEWYLGAMTNWSVRDIEVTLDFLGTGRYCAFIYQDDTERYGHVNAERRVVDNQSKLKINLESGGGCAIRFEPTW